MRLYKYMPVRYVESFLDGSIRFQPLSFYQRYEEQSAIGDPDEAKRVFRPTRGLEINNLTTGKRFTLPATFVSSARAEAVFVFCVSQSLSADLASEFGADACVEITDVEAFSSRLRDAVNAEGGDNAFLRGAVSYCEDADPPIVNWALPDAIVMSKRAFYRGQSEYRFAFGDRSAFGLEQTVQQLVMGDIRPTSPTLRIGPPRVLTIGDIRSISSLHRWPTLGEL